MPAVSVGTLADQSCVCGGNLTYCHGMSLQGCRKGERVQSRSSNAGKQEMKCRLGGMDQGRVTCINILLLRICTNCTKAELLCTASMQPSRDACIAVTGSPSPSCTSCNRCSKCISCPCSFMYLTCCGLVTLQMYCTAVLKCSAAHPWRLATVWIKRFGKDCIVELYEQCLGAFIVLDTTERLSLT